MGIEVKLANCQSCAECCKGSYYILATSDEIKLIAIKIGKNLPLTL
jgi:hypothetical protein